MSLVYWIGTSSIDLGNTANYSGAALPSAADDLYFDNPLSTVDLSTNLDDLSAIALAEWVVTDRYTKNHGTSSVYVDINADYVSYTSSGTLIRYNFGANATNVFVGATGSTSVIGYEAMIIKGSAMGTVSISAGSVGIATASKGETATVSTLNVGSANGNPTVRIGQGVTLATLNIVSGSVINDGADITNVNILGSTATYTANGSANHGTVVISAGRFVDKTNGTITDLTISGNGIYDASQNPLAKTITDFTFNGGSIKQSNQNISFANVPSINGDVTIQ